MHYKHIQLTPTSNHVKSNITQMPMRASSLPGIIFTLDHPCFLRNNKTCSLPLNVIQSNDKF